MDEQFLQYIWKFQKFDHNELRLVDGQSISIFSQGNHNHGSGPDFEEARIKIGDIEWAGHVEIHINSSDWISHNHQNDTSYDNVILHVVWNHNKNITVKGSLLPTLELKKLLNEELIRKYDQHINQPEEIPCTGLIKSRSSLTIQSMFSRALVERLEKKAKQILTNLQTSNNDWEEVTYKALTANFGFSVNKDAFTRLTEILPFHKLKKSLHDQIGTEALFFGQSGFLQDGMDEYQQALASEFNFLKKKYQLQDCMNKVQWKFGKLRLANFPSVRLSQLASIFHHNPQLFTILIETSDIKQLKNHFLSNVSEYWQLHYDFGKRRKNPSKTIGVNSFENILINTIAPLLAAYAKYVGNQQYMDRAIELLESLHPERNRITRKWDKLSISPKNAFDSQACVELYKSYCLKKRCLSCNIGVEILNK